MSGLAAGRKHTASQKKGLPLAKINFYIVGVDDEGVVRLNVGLLSLSACQGR